ncbi:MAG TPA: cupin domain-containing protein [Gaiellaceae bacterium]|nr:cupin domain-containing protein [Gaiellaceae bacterium]
MSNVRDLEWWQDRPRGFVAELVPRDGAQVGANLFVLAPGDPMSMYHWEGDQEGFLVLSGEAVLIVEDEERPLRQWDYFHCPTGVPHTIVGAGGGPTVILALGARSGDDSGAYPFSELAMKHDASAQEETTDSKVAYARFPVEEPAEFREEWLP